MPSFLFFVPHLSEHTTCLTHNEGLIPLPFASANEEEA
jgi:hypothetical protein